MLPTSWQLCRKISGCTDVKLTVLYDANVLYPAVATTMLTGPTPAVEKVLAIAGLAVDGINLFELNEAFASVVLKYQRDRKISVEKLDVNGGAIAMGHTRLVRRIVGSGRLRGAPSWCGRGRRLRSADGIYLTAPLLLARTISLSSSSSSIGW